MCRAVAVALTLTACGTDGGAGLDGGAPDALAVGDGGDAGGAGFVATLEDFQGFLQWPSVNIGDVSAGGHPEGPVQDAYYNRARPAGSRVFPDGTIIVRATETGTPAQWSLFAMAKRGAGYNAMGDVGWEFFRLALGADGSVQILARGLAPTLPTDDAYALGFGVTCNSCHGLPDARPYDGVLDPELRAQ